MFDLQGKKMLVTGANGFVGRNLVAYLRQRGHHVIACTRDERHAPGFIDQGCVHRVLDMRSADMLRSQLADVDVLFHVAADLRNWGRDTVREDFNLGGTTNLLIAAKGQVSRFVLVSTEAVLLGTAPMLNLSERTPYPLKPIGRYAFSKQETEKRVLGASAPGFDCISVRPRMVWGRDDTTILPKLEKAVASGRFLWISHGRYPTSTTHVDNLCEGLALAAAFGRPGQSYFVTDGEPVLFCDFVMHLLRHYQGKIPQASIPRAVALFLGWGAEKAWTALRRESPPPIMRSQVYLTGSPVTIDDSLARAELGYRGRSFAELARCERDGI